LVFTFAVAGLKSAKVEEREDLVLLGEDTYGLDARGA
jgi:hypothetical protein